MAKGSDSERAVARMLSLWWTNGRRDDCVWRTAGSGARFTSRSKKGKKTSNSAGDLCYIDPIIKPLLDLLVIENKEGYNKTIDTLANIDSDKKNILSIWFKKTTEECKKANRFYPMVIFKRTHKKRCVMIPYALFNLISTMSWPSPFPRMMLLPQKIIIMKLQHFLLWCKPSTIVKILKKEVINQNGKSKR